MNHIKRLWGHYLALLILIAALSLPINRVYRFFQNKFGQEVALIALTMTVMIVIILVGRGAVHTHRLVRALKRDSKSHNTSPPLHEHPLSLIFWIFKIDPFVKKNAQPVEEKPQGINEFPKLFNLSNRHRGKPPRFPKEQIRKAVLKWESRDPSITALTLEQFLSQEFGSSPDGILLMATTTFYDWRRRILKELESNEHKP